MRRLQMRNERHFVAVEESLATVATDAAEEALATVATAEAKEPLATVATPRPDGRKSWLARGAPCGVLRSFRS